MRVRGIELHVEESGSGPPILFSHGLLMSGRMFAPQVEALRDRYRCITYDHRGQGRSEVPRGPVIDMETVYEDAVELIRCLGAAPCHFVGFSMGGFVGLRIAARRPELLRSLVLVSTAADTEPPAHLPGYRRLARVARWGGLFLVAGRVMRLLFGPDYLADPARAGERREQERLLRSNRRSIVRAVHGVFDRPGVEAELPRIRTPTLILHGEEDRSISVSRAERMHRGIHSSRLVTIPRSGHSLPLEQPETVNRTLEEFLTAP
jgi:pimeloyl-ACP methyl ester carboxylesterase